MEGKGKGKGGKGRGERGGTYLIFGMDSEGCVVVDEATCAENTLGFGKSIVWMEAGFVTRVLCDCSCRSHFQEINGFAGKLCCWNLETLRLAKNYGREAGREVRRARRSARVLHHSAEHTDNLCFFSM